MKLSAVTIGDRHRKDLGDLAELKASMERIGMLQPIVVDYDGNLIAGMRRVAAARELGWDDIPATRVNLADPLQAEHDENVIRKDFTPSEKVAITEAIFEKETAAAKERQRTAGGKFPQPAPKESTGKARDKAAAAVGWSGRTYQDARRVVEAAKGDPAVAHIKESMDVGGHVHGAAVRLRRHRLNGHQPARTPLGNKNRSTLAVRTRLQKMADALAGYAGALPNLDLRDERTTDLLDRIDAHLLELRRAVKTLRERSTG